MRIRLQMNSARVTKDRPEAESARINSLGALDEGKAPMRNVHLWDDGDISAVKPPFASVSGVNGSFHYNYQPRGCYAKSEFRPEFAWLIPMYDRDLYCRLGH